jgi:hypothetical protein
VGRRLLSTLQLSCSTVRQVQMLAMVLCAVDIS